MRVNTKYSANQNVWYADNGTIRKKAIFKIVAAEKSYTPVRTEVAFYMDDYTHATPYKEEQLFDTKVQAAQAWIEAQGVDTDLRCKPEPTVGLDITAELNHATANWNARNKHEVISSLTLVLRELERS